MLRASSCGQPAPVQPGSRNDAVNSYVPQVIAGYDVEGSLVRECVTTPRLFRLRGVTPMGGLPTSSFAVGLAAGVFPSARSGLRVHGVESP